MLKIRIWFQEHTNSFRTIMIGFFLLILGGAVLLSLPFSSAAGEWTPFADALFTAASASCVTGLVVYNTATYWSLFGKLIILILIQIGGIGIVTAIVLTMLWTGKKIGIIERITLQDSVSAPETAGVIHYTYFFLLGTVWIEAIGAVLLLPFMLIDYGFFRGIFFAIFHSVSAFCNAGFDLLSLDMPFNSLCDYATSVPVNLIICTLIIFGGIGFLTWRDLLENKFHWHQYRLQTKIILASTAVLIFVPFLYFYFLEFKAFTGKERFLLALFQTVTPRTAGFNTYDYSKMSEGSHLITILLMITGGAPGSTAGGMKVTTLAVIAMSARASMRRNQDVVCFRRRIPTDTVYNALTLFSIYFFLLIAGTVLISGIEGLPVMPVLFECASALGTVGLSLGVTPTLCTVSRLILTAFMFFGRVGGLTLAYAMLSAARTGGSRYPKEKVTVG
ncbi:MAG: Trk family potassium uptake protein [Solobacterium sp.]|nr:Trk family potassium uptake protein [Solobacterium sp.]